MSNPKLEIDEELAPEDAPGYVVTAKKTLEEYAKLDAEDESLKKWKESLGISTSNTIGDPNDKRKVVILELAVLIEGRDPIVFDLEDAAALETLKRKPIILKEKCVYRLKIKFRIQHEIVTGLKYLQSVKKAGIRVDKTEENCGSFAPNTTDKPFYEREFAEEEAPSGLLARGSYQATTKFVDDDKVVHLQFPWSFEIKKVWA